MDRAAQRLTQAAAGFLTWFRARHVGWRIVIGLLLWPLLLAARIARVGTQPAVAIALAVALIGQPLWAQTLAGSESPDDTAAVESPGESPAPAPSDDTGEPAQSDDEPAEPSDDIANEAAAPNTPEPAEPAGTDDTEPTAGEPATGASDGEPDDTGTTARDDRSAEPEPAPNPSPAPAPSSGSTLVADLLTALPTATERRTGYDRDLFDHWIDADSDGCDAREEVLIAESRAAATTGSGCRVTGGSWFSFYDATWVYDSSSLDIDHMVPLAEAWDSGAYGWDAATRRAFANDLDEPRALIAVTAGSNRSKSDRDPAEWMPPDRSYHCVYVADWVVVKHRWQLSVDAAERAALERTIAGCGTLTVDAGAQVTPGTAPPPEPAPEPAPAPAPEEGGSSGEEIRVFANCAEMRTVYPKGVARADAAGNLVSGELRPLPSGVVVNTELYEANRARDGDKDGIACE